MSQTRLYLDFDGTLSSLEGSQCINSALYKTLQIDSDDDYNFCSFKENIVNLLKAGFERPENKKMKVIEDALSFLKNMIAEKADVIIISRNREEYIKAVLEASGLERTLIDQITIIDTHKMTSKYQAVIDLETQKTPRDITVICDDNFVDYSAMQKAVKNSGTKTSIVPYSNAAGAFNWAAIERDINQKINANPANPKKRKNFFEEKSNYVNNPLMDALNKGIPRTYDNRPGNQYLVFNDVDSLLNAVDQLVANNYQMGGSYHHQKDYDFRLAKQESTLEIRGKITVDSNGKISLAKPDTKDVKHTL